MKKPSLIKRFFSFLLRLCVVLVLMAAIAVGSFEGVTYYLTGSFTSVKKAVKEETDQSGTEDSTEATTVDNKNMENTLVFVHDDMNNKDYTALNMYNTKTEAMDVLLLPCNAQVSVSSTLLKEIRNTMTEAGSSVNMADVARAFGDKKYEMFAKIVEDISGAKISGYDVISSTNFKKLLNVAGGVIILTMRFLTVIQRMFYRQLMQVMLFLMERQPMHYLLIWMEQTERSQVV